MNTMNAAAIAIGCTHQVSRRCVSPNPSSRSVAALVAIYVYFLRMTVDSALYNGMPRASIRRVDCNDPLVKCSLRFFHALAVRRFFLSSLPDGRRPSKFILSTRRDISLEQERLSSRGRNEQARLPTISIYESAIRCSVQWVLKSAHAKSQKCVAGK